MTNPQPASVSTHFSGIIFRSRRRTQGSALPPSSAETDDELALTTAIPRVKELNDAIAAALLATMPMPTMARDASKECPKCGVPVRPRADDCASCGLAVARMATFTNESDRAVSPDIRTAWDRVLERWQDEAGHDALFHLIAARGEYGWAAGRYRAQARERSGDAIARRHMERIRRAIEATMVVTATARDRSQASPYKNAVALLGVLIVVLVIGMFYLVVKSRSASSDPAPPVSLAVERR
jgi:hypothetical protein